MKPLKTLATILLAILLLAWLSSCRTRTEYIVQRTHTTDTLHAVRTLLQTDTLRDSIYVHTTERAQGDTIYLTTTQYKERTKYRDRILHDTLRALRTDTIHHLQTLTTPATLSRTQRTLITLGKIFAALLALAAILAAVWVVEKRRNK